MNTLEILRQARHTVSTGRFDFPDMGLCTCGHIYAAARGREPHSTLVNGAGATDTSHPIMVEVATALGWDGQHSPGWFISDATVEMSDSGNEIDRSCAIKVIDRAIEELEKQHEQDRLDVLAQTKEVIDSVEVEDVAHDYVA